MSALDKSSSSSAASESRHETKLSPVGRKKLTSYSAEGSRTVHNLPDKDQNYLQGVKDRLNLLPSEKIIKKEKLLKTFSEKDAKDLSALNINQDFKPASYQGRINKQGKILD